MGLRVSAEHEVVGLDRAELGMEAYPEDGGEGLPVVEPASAMPRP
jgi:hypothetical protein